MESVPLSGAVASVCGRAWRPDTVSHPQGARGEEGRVGLAGGDAHVCSSLRMVASRRHRSASMAPRGMKPTLLRCNLTW